MAYQQPVLRDRGQLGPAHTVRFRQRRRRRSHTLWDPTHAPGPDGARSATTGADWRGHAVSGDPSQEETTNLGS